MVEQIIFDISNVSCARKTIKAICSLGHGADSPIADVDRDDFLEVESQLSQNKWDLRKTIFACYAEIQFDIHEKLEGLDKHAKAELINQEIHNKLPNLNFFLFNMSFNNLTQSSKKNNLGGCLLVRARAPYSNIEQIDGFFGPGDLHNEKDKKRWLLDYARGVWKCQINVDKIEISVKEPSQIDISSCI